MQLDQSGKIEQTQYSTVLCLSNGDWYAVRIRAATKRQLQEIFRRNGQVRNYILFTFSATLALLSNSAQMPKALLWIMNIWGKRILSTPFCWRCWGRPKRRHQRLTLAVLANRLSGITARMPLRRE